MFRTGKAVLLPRFLGKFSQFIEFTNSSQVSFASIRRATMNREGTAAAGQSQESVSAAYHVCVSQWQRLLYLLLVARLAICE